MKTPSHVLAVCMLLLCTFVSAQIPAGDIRHILQSSSSDQVYVHTNKGLYQLSEKALYTAITILDHPYNPTAIDLAFAERLLLMYRSGAVKLWSPDLTSSYQLRNQEGKAIRNCERIAIDQYSIYLAVSAAGNTIYICGARNGQLIQQLEGESGKISELCFDPSGRYLAARWDKGVIKLWQVKDGKLLASWNTMVGKSRALRFHPYKGLLSFSDGARLIFFEVETGQEWYFEEVEDFIKGIAFHPERDQLAVATVRGEVQLWQPSTGRLLTKLKHGKRELIDISYNENGEILITADVKRIRFWRPGNGEMISNLALGDK